MKKYLITLFVGFVGLISFGYCQTGGQVDIKNINYGKVNNVKSIKSNRTVVDVDSIIGDNFLVDDDFEMNNTYKYYNLQVGEGTDTICFKLSSNSSNPPYVEVNYMDSNSNIIYGFIYDKLSYNYFYCNRGYSQIRMRISTAYGGNPTDVNLKVFDLDSFLGTVSTSSEQCQQKYSLMPIDSCNSEYCELNGLCETIGGSGSSTLYINDVRHESAPFIYVNIPEEFKRDYLTGEQEFTINVEGLNGDQDYINGIIDVNSYRPSSEDFTQTFVGGLTLIFPYIIITAVILFIRRFIRKIFN